MLEWFFVSFAHAIVGLVLLLTFTVGAVITLAVAITKSNEHDQKRCMCNMCKQRRAKAADKRGFGGPPDANPPAMYADKHFVATSDLWVGRKVSAKGERYQVTYLEPIDFGLRVHLKNLGTGRATAVDIMETHMEKKIWRRFP